MGTFKRKFTYVNYKECINPSCNNLIPIRTIGDPDSIEFGLPIPTDRRKLACSRKCHKYWQNSISWEDRVGKEFVDTYRKQMSDLSSSNNPSTFPGVAEKISNSLKLYLANNPQARHGKNNPFFGKHHSEETIKHLKESKKGKWSYTKEQKLRQELNTPKKENHPNWQGGIANGEYGLEFNQNLKQQIKEDYNLTCQLCNIQTPQLDIHHIDYDKKNNLIENLIPLCKVCHGKTNYNRDTWQQVLTKIKKEYNLKDK